MNKIIAQITYDKTVGRFKSIDNGVKRSTLEFWTTDIELVYVSFKNNKFVGEVQNWKDIVVAKNNFADLVKELNIIC